MRFDAAQRRQPIRGEPNVQGSQVALSDRPVRARFAHSGDVRVRRQPAISTIGTPHRTGSRGVHPLPRAAGPTAGDWSCAQARGIGAAVRRSRDADMPAPWSSGADNSRPAAEGDGAATSGWTNGRTLPRDLCLQLTPRLRADESRIVDVCDETPRPPTMVAAVSGAAAIPEPERARRVSEPGWIGGSAVKLRQVDSLSQLRSLVDMAARRRGGDGYLHELAVWSGRHVSRAGVSARSIPQPMPRRRCRLGCSPARRWRSPQIRSRPTRTPS